MLGPSSHSQEKVWRKIWKAPVHNRIQNFLWRLAKNVLLTRGNLVKKGVIVTPECPICHDNEETVDHLFFHCALSKHVWFLSPLGLRNKNWSIVDWWLERILGEGDQYETQLFCVTLWKIWHHRNSVIFNNCRFFPQAVADEAQDWLFEFNKSRPGLCSKRRTPISMIEEEDNKTLVRFLWMLVYFRMAQLQWDVWWRTMIKVSFTLQQIE